MSDTDRRNFIKTSAAVAGASAVAAPAFACSLGANDRVRVGIVGLRGRGKSHIAAVQDMADENVELAAMCDCDATNLNSALSAHEAKTGTKPAAYDDMRKLLDDNSIDAVSHATPNHWHSLGVIWTCQAGKDAYTEKPGSQTIREGRKMIMAARKYRRICQHGTQNRSSPNVVAGIARLKDGVIGNVYMARGISYKLRGKLGNHSPRPIPEGLDWDMWCGPAEVKRFSNFNHRRWHWIWDYGNGEIGNNSVHRVDTMRLILGLEGLGRGVMSYGGRHYDDAGQTPNTQVVIHDFGETTIVQEVRNLQPIGSPPRGAGILIEGAEGYLVSSLRANLVYDPDGKLVEKIEGEGEDHFANFIKAVRSRKVEDLNAPIVEGHLSTALTHLGNVSLRLGEPAPQAEIARQAKSHQGHYNAEEAFQKVREHLAECDVELDTKPLVLGPWLAIDSESETFVDNAAANAMLTRQYREPFVVPKADEI